MSANTTTTTIENNFSKIQYKHLQRYKFLFKNTPIPIQETNIKNISVAIKALKQQGIINIQAYIEQNQNFISDLYYTSEIFDVNDAILELTEAQSKAAYLKNFKDVMGQPCLEFFKDLFCLVFNGQNQLTKEVEITTFKGNKIWLKITGTYLSNDGEEIINYTFQNISERKYKSQAISLINERLVKGSFQEHLNNLVLALAEAFDLPFVFISAPQVDNQCKLETLALAIDGKIQENISFSLQQTPCEDIYNSKEKVIYSNHLDKIFTDNKNIQSLEGKSYVGYPLFSKNGEIIGNFSFLNTKPIHNIDTLQDVMELYAAWASNEIERLHFQEAFNESQTTLANVLNNIGDVLYAIDLDYNIIAFNDVAKQGFKNLFDSEIEIGKPIAEGLKSLSKQEIQERYAIFKRVFEGETITKEREFVEDGITKYFITIYRPMRDSNSRVIGCVTNSKNHSRLRSAKRRLEKQNATIQKQLEVLDSKNQELEKYIESNMQLENFAYIASHDLKAPIRTIVSFSQLLKRRLKGQIDENASEYLDFIVSSSRNMKQLIEDLLAYSRINKNPIEKEEVNVEFLVSAIAYEIQSTIKEHNAILECNNLPTKLLGDYTQLKQLFQNLITNGIKFHQTGTTPKIVIEGRERANDWLFSIQDNGIGIDNEYFERIFMLFQKLHSNTKFEGTGLGLAICKKIVERHGGQIWLESTVNKGTTFYFTIIK